MVNVRMQEFREGKHKAEVRMITIDHAINLIKGLFRLHHFIKYSTRDVLKMLVETNINAEKLIVCENEYNGSTVFWLE
jgi:cell division protein ZapA (FtsZ GTPase activity inhibitor)